MKAAEDSVLITEASLILIGGIDLTVAQDPKAWPYPSWAGRSISPALQRDGRHFIIGAFQRTDGLVLYSFFRESCLLALKMGRSRRGACWRISESAEFSTIHCHFFERVNDWYFFKINEILDPCKKNLGHASVLHAWHVDSTRLRLRFRPCQITLSRCQERLDHCIHVPVNQSH
jgi:hypothetical protein